MSNFLDVTDPTVLGKFKLKRWAFHLPIPLWMNWGEEINLWNVDFCLSVAQQTFNTDTDEAARLAILNERVPSDAFDHVSRRHEDMVQIGYRFAAQGAQPVVQCYFLNGPKLLDLRMIFQLERDLAIAHAIANSVKPAKTEGEQ